MVWSVYLVTSRMYKQTHMLINDQYIRVWVKAWEWADPRYIKFREHYMWIRHRVVHNLAFALKGAGNLWVMSYVCAEAALNIWLQSPKYKTHLVVLHLILVSNLIHVIVTDPVKHFSCSLLHCILLRKRDACAHCIAARRASLRVCSRRTSSSLQSESNIIEESYTWRRFLSVLDVAKYDRFGKTSSCPELYHTICHKLFQ